MAAFCPLFVWAHCKIVVACVYFIVHGPLMSILVSLLGRHPFMGGGQCPEQGFQALFRDNINHQVSSAVMFFERNTGGTCRFIFDERY